MAALSSMKQGLRRWSLTVILVGIVSGIFFSPFQLEQASADDSTSCGAYMCWDSTVRGCVPCGDPCMDPDPPSYCEDPVPEMPVMLVPFFLAAAGIAGKRIRRKAVQS